MLSKDGLKIVGLCAKEVLGSLGPVATIGLLAYKSFINRRPASYSDAVSAITSSTMFSEDKSEAIAALKMNQKPEHYEAIINIVKSSMFSDVKVKTIISMYEES